MIGCHRKRTHQKCSHRERMTKFNNIKIYDTMYLPKMYQIINN